MNNEAERTSRRALGKGLSALLPIKAQNLPEPTTKSAEAAKKFGVPEQFEDFQNIALDQIQPSAEQPRDRFDAETLEELAQSIRVNGLIQPITVFKTEQGSYRIIAGERRWRAASLAGLKEIPALVRSARPDQLLELALIENLQREDLNPIEVATAFQSLMTQHGLTHEQIAERTGKDRSTITNFIRLLRLTPFVRQALLDGKITVGHARALLNISDPDEQAVACGEVIENQLSVRDTEQLVRNVTHPVHKGGPQDANAKSPPLDPNVRSALEEMARALGTKVKLVSRSGNSGRLEIEYYSQDDLDRIYSVIVKQ